MGEKYTCKYKVIPYRNPFKKLSICGKNLKSVFKNGNTEDEYAMLTHVKNRKGKVVVSLNAGFKLKKIKLNGRTVKNKKMVMWNTDEYGECRVKITVFNKLTKKTEIYETAIH